MLEVASAFNAKDNHGPVDNIRKTPSSHNPLYAVAMSNMVTTGLNDLVKS